MRMFTDDWLPSHPEIGTNKPGVEDTFQEALDFFDARDRYHIHWSTYRNERMEERFCGKVITKLSKIKYVHWVSQGELETKICDEIPTNKGLGLVTCELARGPEGQGE